MAQNNHAALLSTVPLCYGRYQSQGVTPERFIDAVQGLLETLPATVTGTERVALIARNLRGPAHDWFHYQVKTRRGIPGRFGEAAVNDPEEFIKAFSESFFCITGTAGLSDNLSDIHPQGKETPEMFL